MDCMLTKADMSSLTNVINITEAFVTHSKPLNLPLDWDSKDLFRCLDRCVTLHEFDDWHHQKVDWVHQQARNKNLEQLCEEVALALRPAILKARLARSCALDHSHDQLQLYGFHSDRHLIMSALRDVLDAFKAFRVVTENPDLDAVHVRAMIRIYLKKTFELMFLFGKLAAPWPEDRCFFRCWQTYLADSRFEDFEFDSDDYYPAMDRPHLQNTGLSGALADPAQVPSCCLPYYCTVPLVILNPGPYGTAIVRNSLARS
jgi:hypothetical protein